MHIAEGVLSPSVIAAGYGLAAAGVGVGLYRLNEDRIVHVAVLSSAFFVASLIQIPLGPVSIHLVLNGLMGLMLGWAAFPAICVALLLQAVLFGVGGLTVLGVNTVVMAFPAVAVYYVCRPLLQKDSGGAAASAGAVAGGGAIVLGTGLLALSLVLSGREFAAVAAVVALSHLALAIIEAAVTASVASFLYRVQPRALRNSWTTEPPAGEARAEG